jgi:hypothetical protein
MGGLCSSNHLQTIATDSRSPQFKQGERRRPAVFFAVMLAVTAAFYIPSRIHFGAGSWFEFGPFSVQHGRMMLYASYFIFGAGIGVAQMDR